MNFLLSKGVKKHEFNIQGEQERFDEVWAGFGHASCGFGPARHG
jgi:hypothetical protein